MKNAILIFLFFPFYLLAQQAIDFDQLEEKWNRETNVRTYYLDGKPFSGEARQCFDEHPLAFEYEIKNGLVVSMQGFYENGELERDFHFKDGKEHGIFRMYYTGGQIYIEEAFYLGQPHGMFKRWYRDGRLAHEKVYEMGKLISEQYD